MTALADDFRTAVRSAIQGLGLAASPLAAWLEEQTVWTAAHESGGFRFRRQQGAHGQPAGPARGLCQQEPARFADLEENFLAYHPDLHAALGTLEAECGVADLDMGEALERSDELAAAICVLQYLRHAKAITPPDRDAPPADPASLAAYWKRFYNTASGKGTVDEFLADGFRYVEPSRTAPA